ncbi:hypothetical protein [Amycolatopsis magusensis]|uniref:hypothetical protein n=1 Tax=Amycolatopsis magusensis TaxID=882444 RepID=UPI0024A7CC05|nr:hypothetical protein [Amycolatopsis magusensis]MDI5980071.1 hypothetical protein [Amycolatopsis magusensis]
MSTRLRPPAWLGLGVLALLGFAVTAFTGMWSGGKDIDETCAAAGQPLDQAYRARNWQEPGQFFPMHNKCNADYDLVPGWVNPGLVLFAVAAVVCLAGAVAAITHARRNSR